MSDSGHCSKFNRANSSPGFPITPFFDSFCYPPRKSVFLDARCCLSIFPDLFFSRGELDRDRGVVSRPPGITGGVDLNTGAVGETRQGNFLSLVGVPNNDYYA